MRQDRRVFTLGLFLACLSGPALAAAPGPETPVREAYAIVTKQLGPNGEGVEPPWRPPHRDKLMSRGLAELFARDDLYQEEAQEIGHLGHDPFIGGQDGEVKGLRITVTRKPESGKAEVTARFTSFKQATSVRFILIEQDGGWRIDDIVNRHDGKDFGLREALSRPYECGSFMNKPCAP